MTTTTRPGVRRRKIVVERDEVGCLAMFPDGSVIHYATPTNLLHGVKREDARAARAGADCITEIEWRDGLRPPEGA